MKTAKQILLDAAIEDILSHSDNWIHAMNCTQQSETDDDNKAYWEHQKEALRTIIANLREAAELA